MPVEGWLAGAVVVGPAGVEFEGVVVLVDVVPVVGVLDGFVVETETAPPRPGDVAATVRCCQSLEADRPPSAGSGETVPVPRWLVVVVEKVAGDPLERAGDAATATGVTAAAPPWWLWAGAMCPWCATAWWTAWATCPAPERSTRSSRHEADPESDGTKRRLSGREG